MLVLCSRLGKEQQTVDIWTCPKIRTASLHTITRQQQQLRRILVHGGNFSSGWSPCSSQFQPIVCTIKTRIKTELQTRSTASLAIFLQSMRNYVYRLVTTSFRPIIPLSLPGRWVTISTFNSVQFKMPQKLRKDGQASLSYASLSYAFVMAKLLCPTLLCPTLL